MYARTFFLMAIVGVVAQVYASSFTSRNYSNAGICDGNEQRIIIADHFDNNGTINGSESVYIECGKLTGKGIISGSSIEIIVKDFNFVGTIDCSEHCTIITTKTIQSKFKKKGKGVFNIKIDKDLQLPSQKPYNPLPEWWKGIAPAHYQDTQTHKICCLCVQINVDKEYEQSAEWQEIHQKAKDVLSFIDFGFQSSSSVLEDLHELLNALPYSEMQQGMIKGVTCTANSKIACFSEVSDEAPHAALQPASIVIAVFVVFDATKPFLCELFAERSITAFQAINIYFDGSTYAARKHVADTLSVSFCVAT